MIMLSGGNMQNRFKGISGHIKSNLSSSLDTANKQAGELFEDMISLGKSSLSLGKMIFGGKVSKRESEMVKKNVKDIGNSCIEITSHFLPGGKKVLGFINNIIEKKTPKLLNRVIDNEIKSEWVDTIKISKQKPSVIEKLILKIKENEK